MQKLLPVAAATLFSALSSAQCTTPWMRGYGSHGVHDGVGRVFAWDRDGAGPAPAILAVAGAFTVVGTSAMRGVAAYDPATQLWSALGMGVPDVAALAGLPNGDLVAAGGFTLGGGGPADGVARWNGSSWLTLGTGVSGPVRALLTLPNGDLIAGGVFSTAGGVNAANIARWDGGAWWPLGAGLTNVPAASSTPGVTSLALLPNGDLIVGGSFLVAGGVGASNIARWDGTTWFPLGTGFGTPTPVPTHVMAVATTPGGDVIAGGSFQLAGGVPALGVARWNGTTWSAMGAGLYVGEYADLMGLPNGDVLIAGNISTPGGASIDSLARWDGTSWSTFAGGVNLSGAASLARLPNGVLAVGGAFSIAGGTVAASNVALFDGTNWSPAVMPGLAAGPNFPVSTLLELTNGDLIAGGVFDTAGGEATGPVARLRNGIWSSLGFGGSYLSVRALAELPNGDIVAAGSFRIAGGVRAARIARWNGTTWAPLGLGLGGGNFPDADALAVLPNGDLVVGGAFTTAGGAPANRIARWDGSNWFPLGSGLDGIVYALTVLPNGDLLAGGAFSFAGSTFARHLARWDGTSWSSFGDFGVQGNDELVTALAVLPNGDIVVGGSFSTAVGVFGPVPANNLARWDGAVWHALGGGVTSFSSYTLAVADLAVLPDGDLLVGGGFQLAGGAPIRGLARFDGAFWSGFGTGPNGPVHGLAGLRNGEIAVGGWFSAVDDRVSIAFARIATTCPATVVAFGGGCSGSGGANALTALSLPWIGSTFRSLATGMPANALAVGLRGLGAVSLPLSSILPQGGAGCALLVTPDLLDAYVPVAGSLVTQLSIPDSAVLVGQRLRQQVVPFEFDALGNLVAMTSTNALTLTIGMF